MKLALFSAVATATMMICLGTSVGAAQRARDEDMLNQGRVLMFERKWDQAQYLFQGFIGEFPRSALLSQAYFLSARCLQLQGKEAEAIQAYELFLQKFPGSSVMQGQSRNSVIELAAALLDKGDMSYKDRLLAGLRDSRKEVRFFAALRCSRLKDARLAVLGVPVLKEILDKETEPELTNRARIALLRLEPKVLAKETEPSRRQKKNAENNPAVRMLHLVVTQDGLAKPLVELNLPVSMAQMAVAALDESAKAEIRKKGFDVDNIWKDLNRLGPTDILTIRDGLKTVKLWIR
jgi:hypothetical protein